MKYLIFLLIYIYLLIPTTLTCQEKSLEDKLSGLTKVEEIMKIVDNHYDQIKKGKRVQIDEKPYKHWARWALWASKHTDGTGKVLNPIPFIDRAIKETGRGQTLTRSSAGNWFPIGPNEINSTHGSAIGIGRVNRIDFHTWDEDIFYLSTSSGGLLKTTDGGQTYTPLTDFLPSVGASGVVVNKFNPDILYLLTGDGDAGGFITGVGYLQYSRGVFVSYDAGINWYKTADFPTISGDYRGFDIVQDPNNSLTLLVATSGGIFKTTDGGNSWYSVLNGLTYEIKYRPASSLIVYATQKGNFFRSSDGGESWAEVPNFDFPLQDGRVAMAVTDGSLNSVYLFSGSAEIDNDGCSGAGTFGGIYVSENQGVSFTRRTNKPNIVTSCCSGQNGRSQSGYDLAIAASHADPSKLVTGAIRVWKGQLSSLNNSIIMEVADPKCSESVSTGYVHADIHDMEYNPLNHHVYACTDGGLSMSENNGKDWIDLSDGIVASQIYLMGGSTTNPNNFMIGLQDNGIKSHSSGSTPWDHVFGGDGYDIAFHKNSSSNGYCSWNTSIGVFVFNGSFIDEITPPGEHTFFPRVETLNSNNGLVLAGYEDIYRSTDFGQTWSNRGAAGNWDIAVAPNNHEIFYSAGGTSAFGSAGEMYKSTDIGLSWQVISNNSGFPSEEVRITDIDVNPGLSQVVWFTCAGFVENQKVFASFDGGLNWVNFSEGLPNIPINCIELDGVNIYVGTEIGIYYRGFAGGDTGWLPFWNRLPLTPISDMILYPAEGFIRAGTFGRGVWQSDLYSSCPGNIVINSNTNGNRIFESSNTITGNSIFHGGANTNMIIKAGEYIDLKPGFEAYFGTTLHGYISPCGVYK